MINHIGIAQAKAQRLDSLYVGHPAASEVALRGILHALLALHEQGQPVTVKPTRATKEASK